MRLAQAVSPRSHAGGKKSFDISTEFEEITDNIKKIIKII